MVAFTTNKTVAIVALPDARNRPRPILPLTASLPPCEKKPLWTRAPTEGHGGRRDACEVRPGRRRRAAIHADVLRVPGPLARRPRRARPRAPRPTRRGAAARAPRPRHARPPAAERGDHGGLARATRSRRAQEARDRDLGPVLVHLDEPDVTVDGQPVNAAILGTALTLFFGGRAQADRGQGIYFYLPKLEHAPEARWYRDLFDRSREHLPGLRNATIRAVVLVESLPCVYEMEEMLWELGPYAAGLNAARWDLKASIFEFVMADPTQVWPDRFGVDIKTTAFLANIFRRLVAICLKRGAVPIGGMATALPSTDPVVNRVAAEAIGKDKEWEAAQGFIRGWVAHIFHMKTAADPFKTRLGSGWTPTPEMAKPENYPVTIEVPAGLVTLVGARRHARMLVEYVEGWLNGRGAKGIDSLEGKPGVHPALMEDLATGRMSVAQIAQRIPHHPRDGQAGGAPDFAPVQKLP